MNQLLPNFTLPTCVASCLAVLAFSGAAAQTDTAAPVVVEGQCNYSDSLAPLREQAHVFVECDRLEMRRVEARVEISFAFPARLRSIELRGSFKEQGQFAVSAIRLRSQRDWAEAEGQCEFDPPGSDYPWVKCLVKDGPRFYVVNFEPSD